MGLARWCAEVAPTSQSSGTRGRTSLTFPRQWPRRRRWRTLAPTSPSLLTSTTLRLLALGHVAPDCTRPRERGTLKSTQILRPQIQPHTRSQGLSKQQNRKKILTRSRMTQTWHTSLLIRSEFPHKSLTSLLRSSVSSIPGFAHPHS